jgi:hypothetical protein
MPVAHKVPYILLCEVFGNCTCVLQKALIENIYTENELVLWTHWNNEFVTPKINLSVYSIQGLLKADSKDRIGLERWLQFFFPPWLVQNIFLEWVLCAMCSLFVQDFLTYIYYLPSEEKGLAEQMNYTRSVLNPLMLLKNWLGVIFLVHMRTRKWSRGFIWVVVLRQKDKLGALFFPKYDISPLSHPCFSHRSTILIILKMFF